MDVDPPRSSIKRAASPLASSSSAKRPKTQLPDDQLTALVNNMKLLSESRWQGEMASNNDSVQWNLRADVLMHLTSELASTNMKGAVIPSPNFSGALAILKTFTKNELDQWKNGIQNGVENNDWNDLLTHPKLQITKVPNVAFERSDSDPQEEATEASWGLEYLGKAAEALWLHIESHYDPNSKFYAQFCSIVQSSGMGKSKTTDELGKTHFVIPINLRHANSTGYPPADHAVRDFLTMEGTEAKSYRRASCFIDALFRHTAKILIDLNSQSGIEEIARNFRISMTEGQTMKEHNVFRRQFYQEVIQMAKEKELLHGGSDSTSPLSSKDDPGYVSAILPKDAPGYGFPPAASCQKLVEFLQSRKESQVKQKGKSKAPQFSKETPVIILAFDEAHTLTMSRENWSNLSVMRHVLRRLLRFPVFSLFLSTTGKISQFTSRVEDCSDRVTHGSLRLIRPFTDLGFDMLAEKVSLDGSWNLERVTHDSHIVRLGRPLFGSRYRFGESGVKEDILIFAVGKLLNADPNTQQFTHHQKLACLSQRLPIEFNSTTYVSQTAEMKQVEGHLRVCLKVDTTFESMETVSSSEPLLSQAAYVVMAWEPFDPVRAFKSILEEFAVHKGDRGELLVLLLLTMARDKAVGLPRHNGHPECRFFDLASFVYGNLFKPSTSALTKESASALKMLVQDFPDANMHFNHFVKFHDYSSVNKMKLLLLMTRGAGGLCSNNQHAIDTVNVFLRSGTRISVDNIGFIFCQVKNNPVYSQNPQQKFFDSMDPYNLGILEKTRDKPVPLIKIFFALAAKTASLHVTRRDPSPEYDAVVYEIWISGLSSHFLAPIKDNQTNIWESLLQTSYDWKDIYKTETNIAKDLRKSMNPGIADDEGHWSHWADAE